MRDTGRFCESKLRTCFPHSQLHTRSAIQPAAYCSCHSFSPSLTAYTLRSTTPSFIHSFLYSLTALISQRDKRADARTHAEQEQEQNRTPVGLLRTHLIHVTRPLGSRSSGLGKATLTFALVLSRLLKDPPSSFAAPSLLVNLLLLPPFGRSVRRKGRRERSSL